MTRIGVQAMMLKDEFAEHGPFETLRRVRAIGYRAVEVSQIPMTPANVDELARARDELGVEVAALSASLTARPGGESLTDDLDKIVRDAERLGSSMIRIGMPPLEAMASLPALLDFCDRSNAAAVRLAEHGIRLCHHNHHVEFAKHEGRHLLDVIVDRAPDVGLEIDVHWVQRGGLDPVATLRRYGERVAMVHLKDYRIGALPPEAAAALAAGDTAAFQAAFAGVVQFGEVGEGNLDFAAIVPTSLEIGAEYLLVEQDERYGRTPYECLTTSHHNLEALGFGSLF
ncbi:sugar phosphate isomerase/epimerase [Amnibacterium sp. CER49]|uniref:sugar phosphate isomerase/epimerase family protein n=1 Tax=Amnibacterium sp. CER49 TaxID=3039161 RepID=UPI0024485A31|nr:sugar phosphate isomerase/epimerase [Amnibacterium sp. CER49]MDH2443351.1 sugar phosphate isomerase/epimerase [Amnibacterium sp. CER49]